MSERAPSNPPALPGFSYVRPLGTGGFADVFLYQQNMPRRQVAVKVLLRSDLSAEQVKAFNTEADILASLSSHPAIVTIFEASVSADGRPYLVMEYCPAGVTPRYRKEIMPVREVLDIGVRIAGAVENLHRGRLLHRDIKPSNILLTEFGAPVLSDFGIAGFMHAASEDSVALSLPWSPPEVINEEITGSITAEVWSLGATVYSLLAGRTPFESYKPGENTREKVHKRITQAKYTAISRGDVHSELEEVLARSMRKSPYDRQQSAAEFAVDLQRVQVLQGFPVTALDLGANPSWSEGLAEQPGEGSELRGPLRVSVTTAAAAKRKEQRNLAVNRKKELARTASKTAESKRKKGAMIWGAGGALIGAGVLALAAFAIGMLR